MRARGSDSALRCPRRVQRRNAEACSHIFTNSFRPLNAGGDSAARRPPPVRLTLTTQVAEYGQDESAIGSAGFAGIGISLQLLAG